MATGKSDLLDQALIFAGATIPKLTNNSAFIFSYPNGSRWFIIIVSLSPREQEFYLL